MIETQWVMLPALFTGLYHWLIWVAQQERPPRERMTRARPAVLMAEYRLAAQQQQQLAQQWAALQTQHESMRQRSLQSAFAQQQQLDHAFTLQSIQAGAQQRGLESLFGIGSLAPGRMIQVDRPMNLVPHVPPLPGGPT